MATKKVTIGATGDILLHKRVYEKARKKDGSFDFAPMFENVKHLFDKDHLIIVNQESIIGGEELGLKGFPRFNSPIELGYQLKNMNVDIVNIANNHTFDLGEEGILKSIENWEKIGLPYVGAYKSKEDQETLRIFHKNGLRICMLSFNYAEGIKTPILPKEKDYLMNNFLNYRFADRKGRLAIIQLINKIKSEDLADIVIINIHYGKEYQMLPTAKQKEVTQSLSETGAQMIIGHHPHVLQPFEYVTNSLGEEVFVAYSLGNFLSGQNGIYRQIGGYLSVDIEEPINGKLWRISNPKLNLTYVDSLEDGHYKMHLLKDVVDSTEKISTNIGEFDSKQVYNRMISHVTQWMPELKVK